MQSVRAKKHLGQHFLHDRNIARRIVDALRISETTEYVLEIGPGTGILTGYLLQKPEIVLRAVELDKESVAYLREHYPSLNLTEGDFLSMNLSGLFPGRFSIIGNFPYNISSPIFFTVLHHRHQVKQVVGMVQREVGERIAAGSGSKTYGLLSVLLQTFYQVELLFRVAPGAFIPPPKVQSVVVRLTRNERITLPCDENLFFTLVKQAFHTRRKTLRNALKSLTLPACENDSTWHQFSNLRAEQLSVDDFIALTTLIERCRAADRTV